MSDKQRQSIRDHPRPPSTPDERYLTRRDLRVVVEREGVDEISRDEEESRTLPRREGEGREGLSHSAREGMGSSDGRGGWDGGMGRGDGGGRKLGHVAVNDRGYLSAEVGNSL